MAIQLNSKRARAAAQRSLVAFVVGDVRYAIDIAEVRTVETILEGKPNTPFLKFGDRIRIEMTDVAGRSIFGAIDQEVVRYAKA